MYHFQPRLQNMWSKTLHRESPERKRVLFSTINRAFGGRNSITAPENICLFRWPAKKRWQIFYHLTWVQKNCVLSSTTDQAFGGRIPATARGLVEHVRRPQLIMCPDCAIVPLASNYLGFCLPWPPIVLAFDCVSFQLP